MSTEMHSTTSAHTAQPAIDEKSVLHRVVEGTHQPLDMFGPTLEFLVLPEEAQNEFSVLRGVIPPGGSVPLHSHPATEDFYIISGQAQALKQVPGGYEWIDGKAGDYIHVPNGARHGWRNVSSEPLVVLLITNARLGQFFQEAGRPVTGAPQPVTAEDLAHFSTVAAQYRHWYATPEESAAVGIRIYRVSDQ
jgi:quercetin dioxygenase-like cupin family protein